MIRIRREAPGDASAVREILTLAFGGRSEAVLLDRLRERGKIVLSFVSEEAGRITGCLAFTTVTLGEGDRTFTGLAIGPMAVAPEFQGTGVGSALVRHGLERCRRAGHVRVVVLGHPGYYRRFGFLPGAGFGIRTTFAAPADAFMAAELEPGALRGVSGLVRYQPEFDDLDPDDPD